MEHPNTYFRRCLDNAKIKHPKKINSRTEHFVADLQPNSMNAKLPVAGSTATGQSNR